MRRGIVLLAGAVASAQGQTTLPPAPAGDRPPAAMTAATGMTTTGAARVAALEAAAAGYRQVTWRRELVSGQTTYVGYFDRGQLRFIDETIAREGASPVRNRYYFENGVLFYFTGELPAGALGAGPAAVAPRVPVRAEFRGAETLYAVRIEHYGEVKLHPAAVADIRRRAATLARAATAERDATGAR